jgi:cyanophycin synthetase
MTKPDPHREIRALSINTLSGANFWSRDLITRLDLVVGRYEDISSADVEGFRESLERAMPGLIEHRCSIGRRGGFITRLRRGTYAAHIIEHVALELQGMIGHEVGYGRARGGDRPGEYTVAFEHHHPRVGARAAELALGIVQRAFAGSDLDIAAAVAELSGIARSPAEPATRRRVDCGITGGGDLNVVRSELLRLLGDAAGTVETVAPLDMLTSGLPYRRSATAIVMNAELSDVPERYRERDMANRLVSVVADAVPRDGVVVVPAGDRDLHDEVEDAGCGVAIFTAGDHLAGRETRIARAIAMVRGDRLVVDDGSAASTERPLSRDTPPAAQAAAALAQLILSEHDGKSKITA